MADGSHYCTVVVAVVVLAHTDIITSQGLSAASVLTDLLNDRLPAPLRPSLILHTPEIRRTPAGKLDRPALKAILTRFMSSVASTDGTYDEGEAGPKLEEGRSVGASSVLSELVTLIVELLPSSVVIKRLMQSGGDHRQQQSSIANQMSLLSAEALGADSLKRIEILWHIKKLFGVDVKMPQLASNSLAAVAQFIDCQGLRDVDTQSVATTLASADVSISKSNSVTAVDTAAPLEAITAIIATVSRTDNLNDVDRDFSVSFADNDDPSMSDVVATASDVAGDGDDYAHCNTGSIQLVEKWAAPLDRCVDASPVYASFDTSSGITGQRCVRKIVFIGSHGGDFSAIDTESGLTIWTTELRGHIEAAATISANGHNIFVCSFRGNDVDGPQSQSHAAEDNSSHSHSHSVGTVWCLRSTDGKIMWSTGLPAELKSSPVLAPSQMYVIVGCYDGYCYALNSENGSICGNIDCGGPIYSVPTIVASERTLFVSPTRGAIHKIQFHSWLDSITATIELIENRSIGGISWTVDGGAPIFSSLLPCIASHSTHLSTGADANSSPTSKRPKFDGIAPSPCSYDLLYGSVDGLCRRISSVDGTLLWSAEATRPVFSSPIVLDSLVIFGSHDGMLRAVQAEDGEFVWQADCNSALFASPVIATVGNKHYVIATTTAGHILVIGGLDGVVHAELHLNAEIFSTPIVVCTSGGNETCHVYLGCRDDMLHALELSVAVDDCH